MQGYKKIFLKGIFNRGVGNIFKKRSLIRKEWRKNRGRL